MDEASASGSETDRSARWSLRLFGGFKLSALHGGDRLALSGKRERVLLAYLALSPNGRASRRKLTALLWGDAGDETTDNLRVCVWGLRKTLGDAKHRVIASEGEDIVLDPKAVEVDVLAFRRLAAASGTTELEAAAKLYTGEFLEELNIESEEFESWRRDEATRCKEQILDVLGRLMTQLADCGESERAIEAGLRILRLEPFHEPAVRHLMRLYGESGRRGPAVELYRTLADALKTELGALPEPETRALFTEIARGGKRTRAEAAPAVDAAERAIQRTPVAQAETLDEPSVQQAISLIHIPRRARRRNRNWIMLTGALAAIVVIAVFYEFAPTKPAQNGQAGMETARAAVSSNAISVAVLPFANLSGDQSQEFFSDGMTEEITSALAKIPGLLVVARTSAFQFKNQNRDIQSIGKQLHASHLIEGSVRKAGDRVRISVQLISADDGTHIWSEDYDRRLTDIFDTQEDIARTIVASLRRPLGLKPGENLVNNRPADAAVYDDYLRAKALRGTRVQARRAEAERILEQVVIRVPDYAPAWALLGLTYVDAPLSHPAYYSGALDQWRPVEEAAIAKAGKAAQRAIQLDPRNPVALLVLAKIKMYQNNYAQADELNARALASDPDNADVLVHRSQLLADLGYLKQALGVVQRVRLLEPFVPAFKMRLAEAMWFNGQTDEAITILKPFAADEQNGVGPAFSSLTIAGIYAAQGRYNEAADALLRIPAGTYFLPGTVEAAAKLLRSAPTTAVSQSLAQLGILHWVYLYVGASDRALDWDEDVEKIGYWTPAWRLWTKPYASIRKTERFKVYVRSLGFVDYWRQHGWPDLCHPAGADDFACN